jgi:hypothetical protein
VDSPQVLHHRTFLGRAVNAKYSGWAVSILALDEATQYPTILEVSVERNPESRHKARSGIHYVVWDLWSLSVSTRETAKSQEMSFSQKKQETNIIDWYLGWIVEGWQRWNIAQADLFDWQSSRQIYHISGYHCLLHRFPRRVGGTVFIAVKG